MKALQWKKKNKTWQGVNEEGTLTLNLHRQRVSQGDPFEAPEIWILGVEIKTPNLDLKIKELDSWSYSDFKLMPEVQALATENVCNWFGHWVKGYWFSFFLKEIRNIYEDLKGNP